MKRFVIIALLVTNCAAFVSESFECYTCANCQDEGYIQTVECRDIPGGNKTESCVRTEFRSEGKVTVNRHCDVHGEECATIGPDSCSTNRNGVLTVCCCDEELCNSAGSINSSVAMATVATILSSLCYFTGI